MTGGTPEPRGELARPSTRGSPLSGVQPRLTCHGVHSGGTQMVLIQAHLPTGLKLCFTINLI